MSSNLPLAVSLLLTTAVNLHAQDACPRIMTQDSTLNNLVDPPGYAPGKSGTLGNVIRAGNGQQAMILIPGLGFGGSVFKEFMETNAARYRMYAVTLPGFGGTAAPPLPPEGTSFGEQTWTNATIAAIETLMEDEKLRSPVLVGHWLTGTQIALRLAMKHPSRIKAVILLSGSAKMMVTGAYAPYYESPAKRIVAIDTYLAPKWFKTVTRETWDDNNFLPGDYAVNPVLGLRLWREAAAPRLHVWIHYLCEFNAQDIMADLGTLTVPTLLLRPGLEGFAQDPDQNYMVNYCHTSWDGVEENSNIAVKTIPDSRVFLWLDQPQRAGEEIGSFLEGIH